MENTTNQHFPGDKCDIEDLGYSFEIRSFENGAGPR